MGKSGRKIKNHEIILCILVLAVIAAGLLLPETGNLVLLDEFCDVAVIWIVCILVFERHRARSCGRSADGHIDRHTAE